MRIFIGDKITTKDNEVLVVTSISDSGKIFGLKEGSGEFKVVVKDHIKENQDTNREERGL